MTELDAQPAFGSRNGGDRSLPAPRHQRAHRLTHGGALLALVTCATLGASAPWHPRPVLLWNASPSARTGLYRVSAPGSPRSGDTVVAWAPRWARSLAAARGYLPATVPLVKPVAAAAGDRVCAAGSRIFVNGRAAAVRRSRDSSGRTMPRWQGCRRLRRGELFLLSPGVAQAFDGRYFGVTRSEEVVGKARLLWAAH
jgi:conjugative transfer signal peptidase TraF